MAYRVRQTAQADLDLAGILEWLIEQHAGETGLRWLDRMQETMETLSELPRRCGLAPESREFFFEVRQLLFGKKPHFYRILFTVENDTVFILHIRHGRRVTVGEAKRLRAAVRRGFADVDRGELSGEDE